MGLDITAYSRLRKRTDGFPYIELHRNDDVDRAEEFDDGEYEYACAFDFRAGSYGSYNVWKEQLARLAGYSSASVCWHEVTRGPFWELINFSDCDGVIGTKVSAKLANDFAIYVEEAMDFGPDFYWQYLYWMHAFYVASDDGAVTFH